MHLLNIANRAHIKEFYKKVKQREVFILQATVLKFCDLLGYGSLQQIQNFSTISPKLHQLSQKKTGTWGVNITIVITVINK